jgi:hypothetical protein
MSALARSSWARALKAWRLGAGDLRGGAADGRLLGAPGLFQVGEVGFLQAQVALGLLELVPVVAIVEPHQRPFPRRRVRSP